MGTFTPHLTGTRTARALTLIVAPHFATDPSDDLERSGCAIVVVRWLIPVLIVARVVVVVVVGPGRISTQVRQVLAILSIASRAIRLLR